MFGSVSAGGLPVSSMRSVQYLKEDDEAFVSSALKYRYEFETACPCRSEYIPVRLLRIAVRRMRDENGVVVGKQRAVAVNKN